MKSSLRACSLLTPALSIRHAVNDAVRPLTKVTAGLGLWDAGCLPLQDRGKEMRGV